MSSPEKGSFSADISEQAIREALNAVEKRTNPEGEAPKASEPEAPAPAAAESAVAPDEALKKELDEMKVALELSQAKGREMMDRIRDTHDKMLRAVADLDNFKKRAQKEKEEVQKFGIERLLRDFLPVIDNLERALEHARGSSDFASLVKGVEMTRKQFEDTLGKHGVKAFSAVGQPFDPRLHEAMQQVETDQVPAQHVASELVRGFMLNDRLIRPALVVVARPKAEPPPSTETAPSEGAAPSGTEPKS